MKYTTLTVRIPATLLAATFLKVRQGELNLAQVIHNYLEAYSASQPAKP